MRALCVEAGNRATRQEFATMLEALEWRAKAEGASTAFTFLRDDGDRISCTYAELERRARRVAAQLHSAAALPGRALLVFPSGLEFIYAFYGCLMAGVVAVPVCPPVPERVRTSASQLAAVAEDCEATAILTTCEWLQVARCSDVLPEPLARMAWFAVDVHSPLDEVIDFPLTDPDAVSVLQYTSGSTSRPRGVMLSQRQLLASQQMTSQICQSRREDVIVGWVPLYHDLGLSGHVLHPVYIGAHAVLLSPYSFVQKPYRWLKAISDFRATLSGGPNFAYELCARKSTPEERATLDLSCWRVAVNAAEPVRAAAIELFGKTFSECGFRAESIVPVYGLAEATLGVTSRPYGEPVTVCRYDRAALQARRATRATSQRGLSLVSCGRAIGETSIAIVDPQSGVRCGPAGIGEIWVSSPSVGLGYWGRIEESAAIFQAKLAGDSNNYLRTGDLGFLDEGELFVTGRLKDLVIVDGRNHFPEDIELSAQQAHAALRPGGVAVFQQAMVGEGMTKTVLVAELRQDLPTDYEEISLVVRSRIAEVHGLSIDEVVLIERGTLPKTSSGKIQRSATRVAYECDELAVLVSSLRTSREACHGGVKQAPSARSPAAIEHWLRSEVGRFNEIPAHEVDLERTPQEYGLSSKDVLLLASDFGERFDCLLCAETFLKQQPLMDLIDYLANSRPEFVDKGGSPVADWKPWR